MRETALPVGSSLSLEQKPAPEAKQQQRLRDILERLPYVVIHVAVGEVLWPSTSGQDIPAEVLVPHHAHIQNWLNLFGIEVAWHVREAFYAMGFISTRFALKEFLHLQKVL